jgi:hypothetical protein
MLNFPKKTMLKLALLAVIVSALARCGDDAKDPTASTPNPASQSLPSGWDGIQDWTGSVLKFKDKS